MSEVGDSSVNEVDEVVVGVEDLGELVHELADEKVAEVVGVSLDGLTVDGVTVFVVLEVELVPVKVGDVVGV